MNAEEEEEIIDDENYEPQIFSHNPTERIMARRLRIQRRVEALNKQKEAARRAANEEASLKSEVIKTPIEIQVENSMDLLEKLILEGDEYVTNVRVATEAREADRREREGIGKEKLLQQLQDEASAAEAMFNEIADKWTDILKYNDPLHISDDINSQKEKCDELIRQKDALIADLKAKLRSAEINFGIDQKKQIEDVNSVARRIENQIIAMRKAYRQELQMIEEVILAERQLFIEANNKKWDELFKKRDQEEKNNAERRSEDYWNFVKDMDNLHRDFDELFRETTIKLENDCDEVQRELERIKVDALMNSEKLDYNYQILKKREDENLIIRSQQKRRINKLQDVINSLRKKNNDYYKQTTTMIEKLTEEIKKITQSILDIEKKADHMAKVNDSKFQKIWDMNKQKANMLFKRVLQIDKLLHEQQLGLIWHKPNFKIPSKYDMDSYKNAMASLTSADRPKIKKTSSGASQKIVKSDVKKGTKVEGEEEAENQEENKQNVHYKKTLKHILDLIADKAGFLIEDLLHKILEPYLENEKTLIKIDNVFSALYVTEKDDVDLLLEFFFPYTFCPICNEVPEKPLPDDESLMHVHEMDALQYVELASATDADSRTKMQEILTKEKLKEVSAMDADPGGTVVEFGPLTVTIFDKNLKGECRGPEGNLEQRRKKSDEEEELQSQIKEKINCQYHHPLFISSVYVLKALKEFLARYHVSKPSMPTMHSRLSYKRSTVSRMSEARDIEGYWKKYTEIFPVEREQLWDSLLEGLKRYHELLKVRKSTCEEVMSLRKQNADLRRIFANYIDTSDIPF